MEIVGKEKSQMSQFGKIPNFPKRPLKPSIAFSKCCQFFKISNYISAITAGSQWERREGA